MVTILQGLQIKYKKSLTDSVSCTCKSTDQVTSEIILRFWGKMNYISRAVINLPAVLRCLLSVDLLRVGMASVDSFCDLVIIDGAVIIVLEELGDLSPLSKLQIQQIL